MNCGAISANLIESELFGHERGSFTGRRPAAQGALRASPRGHPVPRRESPRCRSNSRSGCCGCWKARRSRAWAGPRRSRSTCGSIAATNHRVELAVSAGKLREDLFYRLNVVSIPVPPLRDRGEDVVLLAAHFLDELNAAAGLRRRLTESSLARLREHRWPGNVRELKNVLERAYILTDGDLDVGLLAAADPSRRRQGSRASGASLSDSERRLILATLDHFEGDKRRAAAMLKISLNTLYSRLREYKLD